MIYFIDMRVYNCPACCQSHLSLLIECKWKWENAYSGIVCNKTSNASHVKQILPSYQVALNVLTNWAHIKYKKIIRICIYRKIVREWLRVVGGNDKTTWSFRRQGSCW